jgi:hypothetical protein
MRSKPTTPAIATLVTAMLTVALGACGGDGSSNAKVGERTLPTRTAEVGSVEVKVSPQQLTRRSALFDITLDTHSGELSSDLEEDASLTVGGVVWPTVEYRGDGPGGHHREGTLRFRGAGPTAGTMLLTLSGLDRPARFAWSLGQSSS